MFHLDGSQTTWLVYADWLEDQGIPASHIRDMAQSENVNHWFFEYSTLTFQVGSLCSLSTNIEHKVGTWARDVVGCYYREYLNYPYVGCAMLNHVGSTTVPQLNSPIFIGPKDLT